MTDYILIFPLKNRNASVPDGKLVKVIAPDGSTVLVEKSVHCKRFVEV